MINRKQLFRGGSVSPLWALFLIIGAMLLMIFDHRSPTLHSWRSQLSVVVYPIQKLVDMPIKLVYQIGNVFVSKQQVLTDNAKLRAHQLLLESKLQKLLVLERENAQLRELLKSTTRVPGQVKVAQLLAVDLIPGEQQLVLDKGSREGVFVGQPVLDAYGVMGQVISLDPLKSKILLVTDTKSAVPVQDSRNGIRSIALGMGSVGKLSLLNVTDTTDIKPGDLFVASGLGLRFPVGYPVGTVISVKHIPSQRFASIVLAPAAHLSQTQQVLLVWPNKSTVAEKSTQHGAS